MKRPIHLPDYDEPPLTEVALGVQFTPVSEYTAVNSSDVWGLFKEDFPKNQEFPRTEAQFETFGGMNVKPSFQFQIGSPPVGSRLWFISDDDSHILQFQPDRLVTNWRKQEGRQPYPRFEGINESFENNLKTLEKYFDSSFNCKLDINQAEVVYVNIIPVASFSEANDWLSLWASDDLNIESLSTSFNEVILDDSHMPFARLKYEIQSVFLLDAESKALKLTLTYRGKPAKNDIESASEFIKFGREIIVSRFDQITTDKAHQIWKKTNE